MPLAGRHSFLLFPPPLLSHEEWAQCAGFRMKVLVSTQTGTLFGWLCGQYPGLVGNLFSTDGKFTPWQFAPYALDNGAFPAWVNKRDWNETAWLKLLDRVAACPMQPEWVLVPDVVADKERTLESWYKYAPMLYERGFNSLAFAAQDGMLPNDVPVAADWVFVGGTTPWKWATLNMWCESGYPVHVGRVNEFSQLMRCYEAGAKSTDGTGWFRGDNRQFNGLVRFLELVKSAGVAQDPNCLAQRSSVSRSFFKYRDGQIDSGENQWQGRLF